MRPIDRSCRGYGGTREAGKAGQLLSEAAVSLDHPERATPAQIVGALAERPLITPEAFVLLREARLAENAG